MKKEQKKRNNIMMKVLKLIVLDLLLTILVPTYYNTEMNCWDKAGLSTNQIKKSGFFHPQN